MAVQFMNTSGPVRVLAPSEYQGTNLYEFGLDHPQLSIALFEGSQPAIAANFGGRNPDDFLPTSPWRKREVFLLSRFVGQEWDTRAAKATLQPCNRAPTSTKTRRRLLLALAAACQTRIRHLRTARRAAQMIFGPAVKAVETKPFGLDLF
jgi:hypothetical protein